MNIILAIALMILFSADHPIDSIHSVKEDAASISQENTNNLSEEAAGQKAVDLVAAKLKAKYNADTDDYSIENESYTVMLNPIGFTPAGEYEVRVNPSYYPLSVLHYFFVDLDKETVREE
ncbi:hypothetical protein G8C92_31005 [Paenibacillus donghaensis]|uniref:hypothetical protein n=1 Tax=Paenibacillus donghaensis TaxID=414771 RepID=UPI0018846427|nr:hypothetical protein [Paenibacillus donghaensis]MBE9918427.1 hypothetical protein [Paenibacillus donghaensis]